MTLPADFQFSQSSLQDYIDCPRRFELRYIQGVAWPAIQTEPALEQEDLMRKGDVFHRLVHQYMLGVPGEALARSLRDDQMIYWWNSFLRTGLQGLPAQRHAETLLTVPVGEYTLVAKYDLLAIEPGQRTVIVDWKTSRRVPRQEWLAERLQTVVYRYVLAVAGAHLNGGHPIAPEAIEMIYWYAERPDDAVRLRYSQDQFQADEARLQALITEIATSETFPLTPDERHCAYCIYRSLCQRGVTAGHADDINEYDEDAQPLTLDHIQLDHIAEIEF